jgi:hypothetical protein
MSEIIDNIRSIGIVPVIKIDNPSRALPLAKALYESGLPVAEVTFRTSAAAEVIKSISEGFPKMLLGGLLTTLVTLLGAILQKMELPFTQSREMQQKGGAVLRMFLGMFLMGGAAGLVYLSTFLGNLHKQVLILDNHLL